MASVSLLLQDRYESCSKPSSSMPWFVVLWGLWVCGVWGFCNMYGGFSWWVGVVVVANEVGVFVVVPCDASIIYYYIKKEREGVCGSLKILNTHTYTHTHYIHTYTRKREQKVKKSFTFFFQLGSLGWIQKKTLMAFSYSAIASSISPR